MDQGLGLLPLGVSGEPEPHCLGGGRWQGPLSLFLSGFEAWLWVAARMLVEDRLWTLDQWENGPQWLDRSLAVFDLIKHPPLFGGEGSKVLSCKECMRPPNICFLSPPPCLPSLIWSKFQGVGSLGHSRWRALLFISAHDARNPCQPPSHRVRCPPECQAISEGPNAAGLQPGAPPT